VRVVRNARSQGSGKITPTDLEGKVNSRLIRLRKAGAEYQSQRSEITESAGKREKIQLKTANIPRVLFEPHILRDRNKRKENKK